MSEIARLVEDLENGSIDFTICVSSYPNLSLDAQLELAFADQKHRIFRGKPCGLEYYMRILLWLPSDSASQQRLTANEFSLRLGNESPCILLPRFEEQYQYFGPSWIASLHERVERWNSQPLDPERYDRVCDRFEEEVCSGKLPSIELYLERVPAFSRQEVLRELLLIETYHLAHSGKPVEWDEYRRRFLQDQELIRLVQSQHAQQIQSPSGRSTTTQAIEQSPSPEDPTDIFIPSRKSAADGNELYRLARQLSQAANSPVDRFQKINPESIGKDFAASDDSESPSTSIGSDVQDLESLKYSPLLGDRDRFAIRNSVAQGGLGEVFVAHDRQFNRVVALKKVRDDRRKNLLLQQKFLLEAEITGQLEHPGVVPIYALGADSYGNPFYAMKFIRGRELKDHIRRLHATSSHAKDFSVVEFLRLLRRFQDVCNTIGYAHTRGVIHRDLKPANLMLGSHGETLVVDWGLAKVAGDPSASPASEEDDLGQTERPIRTRFYDSKSATQYGSFSGTVPYAAPEQLMGYTDRLGPASDIYSLGAILFEILTNEPPLAGPIRSIAEAIQRIQNGDDLDPRNRSRSVPLPLALICRKALSWAPEDRYRTAFELSEDIDRWMADERVLAMGNREPWTEWFGRLLRKHRRWTTPIALTTLFSATVLTAGLFLVDQARLSERTAKEAEKIAKAQELASKTEALQRNVIARDAIDALLVESTRALADFPATRDLQKRLLTAAAADYERLSLGNSLDEGLQLERMRALVRVADIEAMQGNASRSDELYAQSIHSLDTAISKMHIEDEMRKRWETELAKTIARRALAWDTQDRIDESQTDYTRAQQIFDRILKNYPSDESVQLLASRTRAQHASLLGRIQSPAVAIPMLEAALAGFQRVSVEAEPRVTRELAKAKESLARFLGQLGRFDEAIPQLESILQFVPAANKTALDDRDVQEITASVHVSLANLHRQQGNLTAALQSLEQSLRDYSRLRQSWPDSLEYIENEASVKADIGLLWIDRRNPSRAKGELEPAKQAFEELSQNFPSVYRYAIGWSTTASGLGQTALVSEADSAAAVDWLDRCVSLLQTLAVREPDPRSIELLSAAIGQLARARERSGEIDAARDAFTQSREYFIQLIQQRPSEPRYEYGLAEVEWHAAHFERRAGNAEQAAAISEFACTRMRDLWDRYPKNRQYLARIALFEVRGALWSGNVPEQTMATVQQSLDNPIDKEGVTPETIGLRAWVAWQQGNPEQARKQLQQLRDQAQMQLPYDIDLKDWIQELENRFASAAR
jgi:serine/threonine protein kinase/tetratricopeptide (TPR) repeat protein